MICDNLTSETFQAYQYCSKQEFYPDPADEQDRKFVTWTKIQSEMLYQGEVDKEGLRDGRGITIVPGEGINFGYYKHGLFHGHFISITSQGEQFIEHYSDGLRSSRTSMIM